MPNGGRAWLLTRYDDVRRVLTDPRMSNDQARHTLPVPYAGVSESLRRATVSEVMNLDPPDHTKLHKLIARAFSARAAAELRPWLAALAGELIDSFDPGSPVDLVADYAIPFTGRALAHLLGIEERTIRTSRPSRSRS